MGSHPHRMGKCYTIQGSVVDAREHLSVFLIDRIRMRNVFMNVVKYTIIDTWLNVPEQDQQNTGTEKHVSSQTCSSLPTHKEKGLKKWATSTCIRS